MQGVEWWKILSNLNKNMYFHLTYYRDFLDRSLPICDMEITVGLYDNSETPIMICERQNYVVGNTERFKVYESNSKKMSKKSKLIYH